MKYISMKMDPKGRIPAAGIKKEGVQYHAAAGTGLGMLFTRQGGSYLPIQLRPNMVPLRRIRWVNNGLGNALQKSGRRTCDGERQRHEEPDGDHLENDSDGDYADGLVVNSYGVQPRGDGHHDRRVQEDGGHHGSLPLRVHFRANGGKVLLIVGAGSIACSYNSPFLIRITYSGSDKCESNHQRRRRRARSRR